MTPADIERAVQAGAQNPYTLPSGNVQISFSGGRTSAYMLHQILAANGDLNRNNVRVVFANTGREMPATLDFVAEVQSRWGVVITWVEYIPDTPRFKIVSPFSASQGGEPFAACITKNKMLPNVGKRFCTKDLKILPAKRYLRSLGWSRWTNTTGIRADEPLRVRESKDALWVNWHPLVAAQVRKSDVLNFWGRQPFDLRLETTSNCDGCFLKSEANRAAMWRAHPERMQWWADQERAVGSQFIWHQPYDALGATVKSQGDWIFDMDGALCQADGGDCT